ncbi:hypothetical protein [Pseudomonas sp. Irchel 3E13]|uniref:hypothetical protein n=1 Tax=Pseudomonas sp. Irchel 3E13 TaxID=2008975 RepID=UPI000BA32FE3|nr:hypothetical protein [Pseudomonas sp. Irchel 3E13]
MEVQVISSHRPRQATDQVGEFAKKLVPSAKRLPIVQAEAYAVQGLLDILEVRAGRGEQEILVMACSPEQVQAVLEWSCLHDEGELQGLEIYLVRRESGAR